MNSHLFVAEFMVDEVLVEHVDVQFNLSVHVHALTGCTQCFSQAFHHSFTLTTLECKRISNMRIFVMRFGGERFQCSSCRPFHYKMVINCMPFSCKRIKQSLSLSLTHRAISHLVWFFSRPAWPEKVWRQKNCSALVRLLQQFTAGKHKLASKRVTVFLTETRHSLKCAC